MLKKSFIIISVLLFLIGGLVMKAMAVGEFKEMLDQVKSWKLKNGLTVIFYPYQREDVVNVRLCVKVGSIYENNSQAGITHLIEHMIFKGTETRGPEEVAGAIEALGGYMNAFTSYDYTCYYASGPVKILKTALDVLSDVVFHPAFPEKELEKEKQVVLEEMKMRLDNPMIVLIESVMKQTYKKFPYYRPIIGFESTVKSFTRDSLLNYVREFYSPQNMVLTVVGKVSESKVRALVNEFFSSVKKHRIKKVRFPKETFTKEPELVWVKRDVKEGYFVFTLPGVSFRDEDAPYLDLLAQILGGGESSRLYLRLKRDLGLVNSISSSSFTPYGPGMIEISGTAPPENFEKILKEVVSQLMLIKENGVSEEELQRAKIQILSDFFYSAETSEGISSTLASFQILRGSYKDILWYEKAIETATPEDIKRIAEKYLNLNHLVAGFLSEKQLFNLNTLRKIIAHASPEKIDVFTMKNGLKVIMYPIHDVPTVAITACFPGGLRFETNKTDGLFQALTLLWTRGTKHMSAEDIAEKAEVIGGSISGFSGRNTFGLKAVFLSSKLDQGLSLFKEVLLEPTFSKTECDKARPELIARIFKQQDHPISLAVNEFLKELFPNHPYGLNIAGSIKFYESFTPEELKSAYKRFVTPDKGVITIVGDFDPFVVKQKIEEMFKDWKSEAKEASYEEPAPSEPERKYEHLKKDTYQTQILLGFQTPGLDSKERLAIEVLNSALSGQDGRLFKVLREEKSLAYAVTSFVVFYPKRSAFILYIACSPEKTQKAIEGFWQVLEDISKYGLTKKEIQKAKNRLIGTTKLGLQSNLSISENMAVNDVLGLGWNYSFEYEKLLNSVTQKDIAEIIKKYLTKDRAVLFVLGK